MGGGGGVPRWLLEHPSECKRLRLSNEARPLEEEEEEVGEMANVGAGWLAGWWSSPS